MEAAEGVCFSHIARETTDVKHLANFYQEILGFERIQNPNLGPGIEVIWLRLPPSFALHLIQRNPGSEYHLPEGPLGATSAVADPKFISSGHHLCVTVSNFDSVVRSVKDTEGGRKAKMEAAEGVCLSHIVKESTDVKRLANFYQKILRFERLQKPEFADIRIDFESEKFHH